MNNRIGKNVFIAGIRPDRWAKEIDFDSFNDLQVFYNEEGNIYYLDTDIYRPESLDELVKDLEELVTKLKKVEDN